MSEELPHTSPYGNWIYHSTREDGDNKKFGFVYALYNEDDEVVYVGQTISLESRIKTHYQEKEDVTYCKYIKIPLQDLDDMECFYILQYLPKHNKTLPKNTRLFTHEQFQKIDPRFYSQKVTVIRKLKDYDQYPGGYYHYKDLKKISEELNEGV